MANAEVTLSEARYRRGVALEALGRGRWPEAIDAFHAATLSATTESEKAACRDCQDAVHRKRVPISQKTPNGYST